MDKETLSNYGWIVICILVLSVMIALATPFGQFIEAGVKSTAQGLFDVNQAALGSAGIDVNDMVFENCDHLETEVRNVSDIYSGDTVCLACGKVISSGQKIAFTHDGGTIPEGGKYKTASGRTYNQGSQMPEVVCNGDIYIFGNYEYQYNTYYSMYNQWMTNTMLNGWGVRCINDVADPGPILESINGKPITSTYRTFLNCTNLVVAPALPSTVIDEMYQTFYGCTSLKTYAGSMDQDGDFSNYVIPSGVEKMEQTFTNCTLLTIAPEIPYGVLSMNSIFKDCINLTTAPIIPNGVTNLGAVFSGCTALKTYHGSTEADGYFSNYVIPSSVTGIGSLFSGCVKLKTAPYFSDCTKLTGAAATFKNCTSLTDLGNFVIPSSVTGVTETFYNCTSLTGTIEINAVLFNNIGYLRDCFAGVDFAAQGITLTGNCTFGSYPGLDNIGATGTNYCATCNGKCQGNH